MHVLFTVKCVTVYSDKRFMRPAIHASCKKFARGIKSVDDKKRPGWYVAVMTDTTIATVDEFVRSDRQVPILDIVCLTGISRDLVHRIVHHHLKFRKVCAQLVPKQLMPDQQATRMITSLDNYSTTRWRRKQH